MLLRTGSILSVVFLAAGLSAPVAVAQQDDGAADDAAVETIIEIESLDSLLKQRMDTILADAEAGNAAASLAVARAYFADTDPDKQQEGIAYLLGAYEGGATEAAMLLAGIYETGGYGTLPDLEKAKKIYGEVAESGSLDAKVALGRLLVNTDLTPAGRDRGLELLKEAVAAGSITAANFLGELHRDGRAVPRDTRKALEYFSIGLVSGNMTSLLSVGDMLRGGGMFLEARPEVAMEIFTKAAAGGQVAASLRVADMYLRGEAVPQDIDFGLSLLSSLVATGNTGAMLTLGDLYAQGDILPLDTDKALDYYQQAAATNPAGTLRLADYYMADQGSTANIQRALDLYNAAAERGSPAALRALATLYLDGRVVAPNPQRAFDLLNQATSFGDGASAARLAILYASNEPFPADYQQVRRYLNLALAMGNTGAVVDVAAAIAEGPLVRNHRNEAYQLLSSSVESGFPGAAARLARLQLDGLFPAQGLDGVISMLNSAARNGDRSAARFLIGLYRDGYGLLMRPDLTRATDYLKETEPLLGHEDATIEWIVLEATRGRQSVESFQTILNYYDQLSPSGAAGLLNRLRGINDRAYVYVVQNKLAERGLYAGPLHGTMDAVTVRSFNAACVAAGAMEECSRGPLTTGTARALADFIWRQN